MSKHISEHAIGTVLPLHVIHLRRGHRDVTAVLTRREFHSEEWRILDARGGYIFSEGFRFVTEHAR